MNRTAGLWGLVVLGVAIVVSGADRVPAGKTAAERGADGESYLRFAHQPIREPFPDLLRLGVPAELEDQRTAALGYVDVTKNPFRADPTGTADATQAIQAAVLFARDHQMACFFPTGTYLVSDTIECVQQLYQRANGKVFGANRFPNMLVGSRAGDQRPRLLLKPRSPGFGDPERPKTVLHFWARGYANPTNDFLEGIPPEREQPNISMNQMLVNLDIVIGEGNPGAVALHHQAAEGSAIEECTIDATHGLIGIRGGIGSGGSSASVTVIGGRIGLDFTGYMSGTQPTPVITGFNLRGQTECAIRSSSRQTLVAVGLHLHADRCRGPLVQVATGLQANHGELTLVDSVVDFADSGPKQAERVVVQSDRGVYFDNVYVYGAAKVMVDPERRQELAGNPSGWLHVRRHAAASADRPNQGNTYRYPVYVNGKSVDRHSELSVGSPPSKGLQSRHLWPADFPSFESARVANVKDEAYGAKGDGLADDTAAIQRAINQREIVFLPRGCYLVTRTLQLRPNTKLLGVGQSISLLVAGPAAAFGDADHPAPMIRTADSADASTVLAFLGFYTPSKVLGAQSLEWRCGGKSIFRGVEIHGRSGVQPAPVIVAGHGGGNWYNFRDRSARLLVDRAQGPLRFYQFSVQQVTSEVRGSRSVSFFGTKYEGNEPMLVFRDCDQVRLFGHGGNAKALAGASLFVFERTPNFVMANVVDGPTKIGSKSLSHRQGSTDPKLWHILIDRPANDEELKLPPMERPVLYQRGSARETSD